MSPLRRLHIAPIVVLLALAYGPAVAADEPAIPDPFEASETVTDFAAELEFFKVESDVVTSVSRHPESLWGSAAAIYVVTGEDIRRSGAQTVPEALRMVPGLDVAAVDRNAFAVSARGLNNTFADKMLVLLDGRPVYTPLFGGTLWFQWNTFLPDIDRIEVIRGPGGTLWGSNAMQGIINIITKSAEDTRGALVRTSGGSNSQFEAETRYGERKGNLSYRLFARWATDEGFGGSGGNKVNDEKDETRAGYRLDWDFGHGLNLMSSTEILDAKLGSVNYDPLAGGAFADLGEKFESDVYTTVWRLNKDFADGSSGHLQIAGDYIMNDVAFLSLARSPAEGGDAFTTIRRSIEVELQHSFRPHRRHRLTWGANYRYTNADTDDSAVLRLTLDQDELNVIGGYIQDQITLWSGAELTLGTKVEDNTFTGTNVQPSARMVQRFGEATTLWGAVSRAVNTPSYGDMFVNITLPPVDDIIPGLSIIPIFRADGTIDDTEMIAYELGFRHRFRDTLSLDVAVFYNDYDKIMTFSGNTRETLPSPPGTLIVETLLDNFQDGYSYGAELVADIDVTDWLSGEVNASWQNISLDGGSSGTAPEWKINFRPEIDVSPELSIVPTIHVVDEVDIPSLFGPVAPATQISDYTRLDIAAHYKPAEGWPTFSLVGQNLTDRSHAELFEQLVRPERVEATRSWYLRVEHEF